MGNKRANRLFDLDIDEISLVDRSANQYATVAFSKRHEQEDEPMTVFDAEGVEVFDDELELGDVVYAEDGTELVFTELADDGTSAGMDQEYYEDASAEGYADSDQYELVGKGRHSALGLVTHGPRESNRLAGMGRAADRGVSASRHNIKEGGLTVAARGQKRRNIGEKQLMNAAEYGDGSTRGGAFRQQAGMYGGRARSAAGGAQERAGQYAYLNPGRTAAIGAGSVGAAGAGGYAHHKLRKSYEDSVYSELSKALNDSDRDQVIAKALGQVQVAEMRAARAEAIAKSMADTAAEAEYAELAAEYGLPADPARLGPVLKRLAEALPDEDLAELDRVFKAFGAQEELLNQVGLDSGGYSDSPVMDEVSAFAHQVVGKSDGLSLEQATVAVFENNPAAYDEYVRESSSRR